MTLTLIARHWFPWLADALAAKGWRTGNRDRTGVRMYVRVRVMLQVRVSAAWEWKPLS